MSLSHIGKAVLVVGIIRDAIRYANGIDQSHSCTLACLLNVFEEYVSTTGVVNSKNG